MINMNFTEEEQKAIRDQREQDKYWEELHEAHNRITNGIANNKVRSGERAIWELMQNARDLAKEQPAITEIRLSNSHFTFKHKGLPFTLKTLESLIKQRSSKYDEKENSVGRYGTGFMTTHVFSLKVHVTGCCKIGCGNKNLYVPLPDGFILDRSIEDDNEFVKEMDRELKIVDGLISKEGMDEPTEWTEFTYQINEDQKERISKQISTTTKLMPFVLLFNKRIKECTIIDETKGTTDYYTKEDEKEVPCNYDEQIHFVTTKIKYIHSSKKGDDIVIYSLRSADGNDQIVIPPLPLGFNDTNTIPSQFLFFPLLGTEHFGTNFIFHSSRLYPTEPRDSYQLPEDNNALVSRYKHNEMVLDELFEMLFSYYRNNSNKQNLPLSFADISFTSDGDQRAKDDIQKEYYKKLQNKFVNEFFTYKIFPVKTSREDGTIVEEYKALSDTEAVKLMHPDIYQDLSEEQIQKYESVLINYANKAAKIPSGNVLEWSQIVANWGVEDKCYVTLKDICEVIKEEDNELHTFLLLLKDLGQVGYDAMANYAMIPNREGNLLKRVSLRDGKTINDNLYNLAKPILGTKASTLVNPNYADVYDFPEYTRSQLRDEIKSSIDELRKQTLSLQEPKLLEEIKETTSIEQLISYCSGSSSDEDNFRVRVVKTISDLYEVIFKKTIIPNVPNDQTDLYESAFNYLVENTMLMISLKGKEWLTTDLKHERNHECLLRFVKEYSTSTNKDNRERMRKYGIFPNQVGEMCLCSHLKKNLSIEPDFTNLYLEVVGEDLHNDWVDDDFCNIHFNEEGSESVSFIEMNTLEPGLKVEKLLRSYLDEKRKQDKDFVCDDKYEKALTIIVNKLENGCWAEYFDYFAQENNLRNVSYEIGSKEQKDALYRIKISTNQHTLKRLADIASSPDLNEILEGVESRLEREKEKKRQFTFTYAIGKHIEDILRSEISEEISCTPYEYETLDEQYGQDIVIRYKDSPLFYLESKAKWTFNDPAHMSSLQMKQAVRHKDKYALLCVDCTPDTGSNISPDATEEQVRASRSDIFAHTYVHNNIGKLLSDTIGIQVKHEDDSTIDEKKTIKIYSNYSCNITKEIFISGKSFSIFMYDLKNYLKQIVDTNK